MKTALRDLQDDLQMCMMRLIEIRQYLTREGKVETPEGYPRRTFTGTYRGSKQGLLSLPDQPEGGNDEE